MENLGKLQEELEREFISYATDLKVGINIADGFGNIG